MINFVLGEVFLIDCLYVMVLEFIFIWSWKDRDSLTFLHTNIVFLDNNSSEINVIYYNILFIFWRYNFVNLVQLNTYLLCNLTD